MHTPDSIQPPRWPIAVLRFLLKKEYLEEIEGDLEEHFADDIEQMSVFKARMYFIWNALTLVRPSLLRHIGSFHIQHHPAMFRNYFKISFRSLMRQPFQSFINIFGLSAAIGICIFTYAFSRWTYSMDQFHTHKNEVYLTTFYANRDGSDQQFGRSPAPLGAVLRKDFPQIKQTCRVEDRNVIIKYGDLVFNERLRFVDPEFLEMLTFPLKWGQTNALRDMNSIILSEEMAVKYFGSENPVGKTMLIKFDGERSGLFTVGGVAEAFPKARTISFHFLVRFENLQSADPSYDVTDWKTMVQATLVRIEHPADVSIVQRNMAAYQNAHNAAASRDWAITSFVFEPLATLHQRAHRIRDDISRSTEDNYTTIYYLTAITLLMLALACFNYINIAIVSAAKRLKEIGIRKSIGATRSVVSVQFLAENLVITLFAMIGGYILATHIFIPGFEYLWHFSMGFEFLDPKLWIFLAVVLVVTSIASGIYPALYISRFHAAGILKGSVRFGKNNPLTKVLLSIQLVLACMFMTCAVDFTRNTDFLSNRSWGYENREVLYTAVPDRSAFEQLRSKLLQEPNVLSISGSTHHLGKKHVTTLIQRPERAYEVDQLFVDAHYFQTMGIPISRGRYFPDEAQADQRSIVINETMVKHLNLENPIGHKLRIDSTEYSVIGVTQDIHVYDFSSAIRPTLFRIASPDITRFLSVKVRPGTQLEMYRILKNHWSSLFPEIPFDGGYQEDVWGRYYETIGIHGLVWRIFAFFAVAMAGLGLYGLITYNVTGRIKEFSIRKVLGAEAFSISALLSRPYTLLYGAALLVGMPLSYLFATHLLVASYPYHMPVSYTGVFIAALALVLVLALSLSIQIHRILKSNPVEGLRTE
ncbi:MAG TPA: ABC transporter permease [bacterium]|nr:ABC transporter permease [bacterium]